MNVAVLGTGVVGQTLAAKISDLGHDVVMGTRDPAALERRTEPPREGLPAFSEWHAEHPAVRTATFAEAAAHGEIAFLATSGRGAVETVTAAAEGLAGKVVVDITNALDFSEGYPGMFVSGGGDSLAEQIQRAVPGARVVKSLNTVTAAVMVDPSRLGDDHVMFVAGDDEAARGQVASLLRDWFGWREVVDLGDVSGARALEAYILTWVRLWGTLGTPMFNITIRR